MRININLELADDVLEALAHDANRQAGKREAGGHRKATRKEVHDFVTRKLQELVPNTGGFVAN